MIIKFKTKTGSTYRIDENNMTWERIVKSPTSGEIRREKGNLLSIPALKIGHGAIIHDAQVKPGTVSHHVYTSDVVEITESL